MKRAVRLVLPGAWHPLWKTATKVERQTENDPQGPARLKEIMRLLLWSLKIVWYSMCLNERIASEIGQGTFIHLEQGVADAPKKQTASAIQKTWI